MIWRLILLLCCLPFAATAQVVVKSGEHDGFSRLVLDFGAPVDWRFGRTLDGYALEAGGQSFDLGAAFELIPKTRIAALGANGSRLQIGVACACHAIPFEFRPGIVVIDIKDGPPPQGSAFEASLPDQTGQTEAVQPPANPPEFAAPRAARPDDAPPGWVAPSGQGLPSVIPGTPLDVADAPNSDLAPLRDELLRQMADGAARGVIDITGPAAEAAETIAPSDAPMRQIRIGEDIGFDIGKPDHATDPHNATGVTCIAETRIDLPSWGAEADLLMQLADTQQGLVGEFDKPQPEAVEKAVRFYLYLGFGLEARQLLVAMESRSEDRSLWETMARIMDGEAKDYGIFAGMEGCDNPAALWWALASPYLASPTLNLPALQRSFSALPLHLRRSLGPDLSQRLRTAGHSEAARIVADSILRAAGDHGPEVELMTAEHTLKDGDAATAKAHLEKLAAEPGPMETEALIAFVDLQIENGSAIDPGTITSLAALIMEHKGAALEPALQRAHLLAVASTGDFDQAFALLDKADMARDELWSMLADHGSDRAILTHGILRAEDVPVEQPLDTRRALAQSLLDLGFPDPARLWLPEVFAMAEGTAQADLLLAGRIALKMRDARTALRLLSSVSLPDADPLRAIAQSQLGNHADAASLFQQSGYADGAARAARAGGDWPLVETSGPEPWKDAASLVVPDAVPPPEEPAEPVAATTPDTPAADPPAGPLAQGRSMLEESAKARSTLDALLQNTLMPSANPPGAGE